MKNVSFTKNSWALVIRKYKQSDKEKIIELLRLNSPEYFSPDEEKDLIYYLDYESHNYFVVEDRNMLVGCGGFNLTEDGETAKIAWDFFDPSAHRKGLGTKLMLYRIDKIKQIKSVKTLSVRTSQMAYRFYQKFGMELRETVKNYWAEGFDLYRLDCDMNEIIDKT